MLESCHSTWEFEPERGRFRRIVKGTDTDRHPGTTEWRPYYGVESKENAEAFVVLLNPSGTRLIQSWHHTHDCLQCGTQVTGQVSLDDINALLHR